MGRSEAWAADSASVSSDLPIDCVFRFSAMSLPRATLGWHRGLLAALADVIQARHAETAVTD